MDTRFHVECVYITNHKLKSYFNPFSTTAYPALGVVGGPGTLPGYFWAKAGLRPGRVSSSSKGPTQRDKQLFTLKDAKSPCVHVFGLWEDIAVWVENPCMHIKTMQLHTDDKPWLGIKPTTFSLMFISMLFSQHKHEEQVFLDASA